MASASKKLPALAGGVITTPSYDRAALDAVVLALVASYPEIAAQITACRYESVRAGSLRIEPERKGKE